METASATTATPAPAAGATTATETPKSASEKLHERFQALQTTGAEPAPVTTAEVEMPPELLSKLTVESEKRRAADKRAADAEAKAKAAEASTADVAALREAKELLGKGDRLGALKKIFGDTTEDETKKVLQDWISAPGADGKTELTAEEIQELRDEANESKRDREARAAATKMEADQRAAAGFSAHMRDTKDEAGAPRWPLASKAEHAEDAAKVALEKATAKAVKLGVKEVTKELAEHLFTLAYDEIEANLTKAAKAAPAAVTVEVPRAAVPRAVIPRAGTLPAAGKTYAKTPEGAREKLLDSARTLYEKQGLHFES